ncbi:V-type ATPase, G subunit family protein [Reticulomyxa filosa]|uniref:V-type ATPase, G subunit family protein n=1 Tax=Reticulomyxa filosa TaxID=46433 RepID=X6MY00_RETFI|nr:V-type ATPase, G subunit family protein [Reticulomyxa filosa]|eukprot:ETO18721.1 V-type ATPase, G subunit family protein [Reticulomyxa filosa]
MATGIQDLMKAEKDASDIVNEVKQLSRNTQTKNTDKGKKLTTNEKKRDQREEELNQFKRKLKESDTSAKDLEKQTQEDIAKLKVHFEKNVDEVIELLLKKVEHVDLTVPDAYRQGANHSYT